MRDVEHQLCPDLDITGLRSSRTADENCSCTTEREAQGEEIMEHGKRSHGAQSGTHHQW